jgi:nucleoside-diphosphate-sugar epimerase
MDAYQPSLCAVTGATGALGLAFLEDAAHRNPALRFRLLVRRSSASFQSAAFQNWLRLHESRVTLVEGDIRHLQAGQLAALSEAEGGLWHFAALTSLSADSEQVARDIREVNLEATERLLGSCLLNSRPVPFYHISTAYVAGRREGVALESEDDLGQTFRNPYEASKLAAELSVRWAFTAGLPGAIFRPSVVVDDAAGSGGFKMVDACAYAVALAVKRGEPFVFRLAAGARINLVHSDWVIAAMNNLARLPFGSGCTYHLSAARSTYFRDIAAVLEDAVPGLKLSFEPGLTRSQLPVASKIFDKAVKDLRPYLEADLHFDRTNTERDLSPDLTEPPLDLAPFVRRRLQSELGPMVPLK